MGKHISQEMLEFHEMAKAVQQRLYEYLRDPAFPALDSMYTETTQEMVREILPIWMIEFIYKLLPNEQEPIIARPEVYWEVKINEVAKAIVRRYPSETLSEAEGTRLLVDTRKMLRGMRAWQVTVIAEALGVNVLLHDIEAEL